jgi:two-component system nitrate/nitrite response regulator NarL
MQVGRVPKRKIRVLVADQGGVFRLGLRKLFGLEDDLRVVAQADKGFQVPGLARKFRPDLFFVQAELTVGDPKEFISRLRRAWAGGKIVIMAWALAGDEALQYVKAGAAGVILKSVEPELFVKCARKVMKGELWLPAAQVTLVSDAPKEAHSHALRPVETLTRREKSIISCLIQGWRNREIAHRLRITEQTVKNHLRTIYDKVGVSDRLELALYAIHQRLELPPVPTVEGG